jgi:hypothetical protein
MAKEAALLCAALMGLLGALDLALAAEPAPAVPADIQAPDGERAVLHAHAVGVQIYGCTSGSDGTWQWTLKGPEAELRDSRGKLLIRHFAGPSWKHVDGSELKGKAVGHTAAPDGTSIPWLLLTVVTRSGAGALAAVTSIQRINTQGGQPPATGCSAAAKDTESRSPYSADYYFYAPAGAAH